MTQKIGHLARGDFQRWQVRAEEEAQAYAQLKGEISEGIDAVRTERNTLASELATVYLPALTDDALLAAERRTGFRGFSKRNPLQALPRERDKLTQTVASLEAETRYIEREQRTGPYGSLTRKLQEAQSMAEPWERDAARFESHEGFLELIDAAYDTPEFTERWWQPSYWRHWAAGDRICAALEMADFGDDVRPAYLAVRAQRDDWRGQISAIQAQIQDIHELVRRHDELLWRRDNLEQIYLDEGREVLARHLLTADVQLLATWAENDRGIIVLLKRFAGLHAKEDILLDMRDRWVESQQTALSGASTKFMLKATKLARPKKAALPVDLPEGVDEKLGAHPTRREKARALLSRVRTFDAYDRYNFDQPPETWYLHVSGNRRPSAFTPQLQQWYQAHPTVVVITDPLWEDDRVDLSAGPEPADTGDIS